MRRCKVLPLRIAHRFVGGLYCGSLAHEHGKPEDIAGGQPDMAATRATESLVPVIEKKGNSMSLMNGPLNTLTLEQETNPWEAQAARFDFAAKKLHLDEGIWKVLRYP